MLIWSNYAGVAFSSIHLDFRFSLFLQCGKRVEVIENESAHNEPFLLSTLVLGWGIQWWIFWPEMLIYAPAREFADSSFCLVSRGIFCVSSSYRVKIDKINKPYFSVQGAEQSTNILALTFLKCVKKWAEKCKFLKIFCLKRSLFLPCFSKFWKIALMI